MRRFLWPLLIFSICLPLALLAWGVSIPGLTGTRYVKPLPVPEGDIEIAWLNTTTSAASWERFIAGVYRAQVQLPGLIIDGSNAFLDQTTAVPEIVLWHNEFTQKIRIRWYKFNSSHGLQYWTHALAARSPAPLAIIGGGSSDRARDVAMALAKQDQWVGGDRPLFLITNATAETVYTDNDEEIVQAQPGQMTQLLKIYDGRSFRFCYSNRQMAEAMLDFIWSMPHLRPHLFSNRAASAVGSGLMSVSTFNHRPNVYYVEWNDDPYSGDLIDLVKQELPGVLLSNDVKVLPRYSGWQVPFSVGGFYAPNQAEQEAAQRLIQEISSSPDQRSLLIIPTVTSPARRFIRTLAAADPNIGEKLIAINGDGMGANTVLRDSEISWPVQALPVPLLLFTHNNPMGWDDLQVPSQKMPIDYNDLRPPNSTEDVLQYSDMVKTLVDCIYPSGEDKAMKVIGVATRADELAERIKPRFDVGGNRKGGYGEYILLVSPRVEQITPDVPLAQIEVWRRGENRIWKSIRNWSIPSTMSRIGG